MDIGQVTAMCWNIRQAMNMANVGMEKISVVLSLPEAEEILKSTIFAEPGDIAGFVRVSWVLRDIRYPSDTEIRISNFPIPERPVAGKKWLQIYGIPVYVVDADC